MSKFTMKNTSLFQVPCVSSNKCNGLKDARPNDGEVLLLLCAQVIKSSTSLSWVAGSCARCMVSQMNECKAARRRMCSVLTVVTSGQSWQLRNSAMNEGRPPHCTRWRISRFETGCTVSSGSFVDCRQYTIRPNVLIPPWVTPIW